MRTLLILLAVLPLPLLAAPGTPDLSAEITVAEMSEHVKTLASDEYEGRRPGQPGGEKAAVYIEKRFKEIGLFPIGDDMTYRQTFDLPVRQVARDQSSLTIRIGKETTTFAAESDWMPFPAGRTADLKELEVVFAGYGIRVKGWNDYASLDVKGKAVLILRHCPNYDPDPRKNRNRRRVPARQ